MGARPCPPSCRRTLDGCARPSTVGGLEDGRQIAPDRAGKRICLPLLNESFADRVLRDVAHVRAQIFFGAHNVVMKVLLPPDCGPMLAQPETAVLLEVHHRAPRVRVRILTLQDQVKMVGHETVDEHATRAHFASTAQKLDERVHDRDPREHGPSVADARGNRYGHRPTVTQPRQPVRLFPNTDVLRVRHYIRYMDDFLLLFGLAQRANAVRLSRALFAARDVCNIGKRLLVRTIADLAHP